MSRVLLFALPLAVLVCESYSSNEEDFYMHLDSDGTVTYYPLEVPATQVQDTERNESCCWFCRWFGLGGHAPKHEENDGFLDMAADTNESCNCGELNQHTDSQDQSKLDSAKSRQTPLALENQSHQWQETEQNALVMSLQAQMAQQSEQIKLLQATVSRLEAKNARELDALNEKVAKFEPQQAEFFQRLDLVEQQLRAFANSLQQTNRGEDIEALQALLLELKETVKVTDTTTNERVGKLEAQIKDVTANTSKAGENVKTIAGFVLQLIDMVSELKDHLPKK